MSERMDRLNIAAQILNGMLASAPMTDRTKINKRKWCAVAFAWTDALLKEEDMLWNPIEFDMPDVQRRTVNKRGSTSARGRKK